MKPNNYNRLKNKKIIRAVRMLLMLVVFLPCWHMMGTSRFIDADDWFAESGESFDRRECMPYPSAALEFQATAYCDVGITKSGVPAAQGIVAGDPEFLPLGSWIHLEVPEYSGIYRVMDTGRLVKGTIVDVWIPNYDRALEFGRQKVKVTVLKHAPFRRKATPFTTLDLE
jgi:3D (Asp-Asp-Asp) domain-containing protein